MLYSAPARDLAGSRTQLNVLSKQGRWQETGRLIDDGIPTTFSVVGEPAAASRALRERYEGPLTRVTVSPAHEASQGLVFDIVDGVQG